MKKIPDFIKVYKEGTKLVIKNIPNLISQNIIKKRQSRYNSTCIVWKVLIIIILK